MTLNPYVWLPHFEFTLQTIAVQYPKKPNEVTKKKYYEFISNIPVFFPIKPLGKSFSNMLNKYPVTPYLDSRESFIKWVYFIHNRVNKNLGYEELTLSESLEKYYKQYENCEKQFEINNNRREHYIYFGILLILIIITINVYKKS